MKKVLNVFLCGILSLIDCGGFQLHIYNLFAIVLLRHFMIGIGRVLCSMYPLRIRVEGIRSCLLFMFHLIYY